MKKGILRTQIYCYGHQLEDICKLYKYQANQNNKVGRVMAKIMLILWIASLGIYVYGFLAITHKIKKSNAKAKLGSKYYRNMAMILLILTTIGISIGVYNNIISNFWIYLIVYYWFAIPLIFYADQYNIKM